MPAQIVGQILEQELQRFETKRNERLIAPMIADLSARGHQLADDEVSRFIGQNIARYNAEQEAQIRQMAHAMVNKLLHQPIIEMKSQVQSTKRLG